MSVEKKINIGERLFCEWQLNMAGAFLKSLIDAMMRADETNQQKLYLAYPELMQAVVSYQNVKGYWSDLKKRYEEQYDLVGKLQW